MTFSQTFTVMTQGFNDTHDITPKVEEAIRKAKIVSGIATVFVSGSTAGITTIEFEGGVMEDLKKAIERLAPQNMQYAHDRR